MYDMVWSRPMTKVAEDLGISDVALKKICDKHRVPTPPRGYWAKREAGKPTKQIPLHSTADPQHEHIVIHGSRNTLAPEVRALLNQERERRSIKARPISSVESTATSPIQDPHGAIAATARALRKPKAGADGVVRANGQGCCGIEVGTASVERAIAILDAIARGIDARGLTVEPVGDRIRVTLPPDSLTFSLVERIERRNHEPTVEELSKEKRLREKEERDRQRGIWSFSRERAYPEFDFIRTGELSIQIADEYVRGLRRNWGDGKRQKIESLVDDIVGGIATYLAGVKARREERERWKREWEQQEERARLARAREERETQRREFLKRFVRISIEADELKSFVARLRELVPKNPTGELSRMMEWAEAQLLRVQSELTPDGVAAALRDRGLFPEIDNLAPPDADE
ncbi:RWP-RK domain-containing protein [Bradyrhizobium sp. RD5-C2]|uniref:RWP-RK domain-containing protein n=1 Tax=Bradyrhizobium sp. RD5-C2 TaxID=244562 RepID=UPI001CC57523|nr:RWP-RK domain-containing protein [Bradyrhizobium sp. RD5-C2]